MFAVLSPAKKLDLTPLSPSHRAELTCTLPPLLHETEALLKITRTLSPETIAQLMKLSAPLAQLNYERFQTFSLPFTPENAKPAALCFNGDTYLGLDAPTLSNAALEDAQSRVGILSGLYGILRPLDLIQPYRLEMGTRLENPRGSNLYHFWGTLIAEEINHSLARASSPTLITLASNEYFKAVPQASVQGTIITPVFKEIKKNAPPKVISFCAKRARGMMARYMIDQQLTRPEDLKTFSVAGYGFDASLSSPTEWVFTRKID